jgi:hypothetical protein
MDQVGPITATSRVDAAGHSPVKERVGRYLFWTIVVAILFTRAVVYAPTSHPVSAGAVHQAKTGAAEAEAAR